MRGREWGALFLVWLTACAGAPQGVASATVPTSDEAELAAIHHEVKTLTEGAVSTEPVKVSQEEFQKAIQRLVREVHPSEFPRETARLLLEEPLQADLLMEVEAGRVVRMVPLEEDTPLFATSNAALVSWYQGLCAQRYGGGSDCLGLNADGPVLDREDRRTLALAWAFDGVLAETGRSLKEMVNPQAAFGLLVGMALLYFALWLVPEPVTKGLAALMTLAFVAWLGVDTVWSLMKGWAQLAHAADRATTPEELKEAGRKFSRVMGDNTARVVMLVLTAAVGGGAARFSQRLPKLPGYERAAAQAEAQGVRLTAADEVEAVAAPMEGTFTLIVRSPGGRSAAATEAREGSTTIIRHRWGNRQIFINGQRWHVPKNKSVKDIPTSDPVGDQLQEAVLQAAQRWHPGRMSNAESTAVNTARAKGEPWKANLLESEARGRYVHRTVANQFKHLRWNSQGVDAIDLQTGHRYELLTRSASNMERHGRRMSEELFRMIGF